MAGESTKSDASLREDVVSELAFDPGVRVSEVTVEAKAGVVTLGGFVSNYGEKWDAVRAARRISGVKSVTDDIRVRLPSLLNRSDGEIAIAATGQIDEAASTKPGTILVTVATGIVTLNGQVDWWYQKNAAETVVRRIQGVRSVVNHITIRPAQGGPDTVAAIVSAFGRNALLDVQRIRVEAVGDTVVLHGTVRSHAERDEAERTAWAASGVAAVENRTTVEWAWGLVG